MTSKQVVLPKEGARGGTMGSPTFQRARLVPRE
jgi:hypothetical protein